jgi:hypothetical protein
MKTDRIKHAEPVEVCGFGLRRIFQQVQCAGFFLFEQRQPRCGITRDDMILSFVVEATGEEALKPTLVQTILLRIPHSHALWHEATRHFSFIYNSNPHS